jgi:hypothetical protein
VLKTNFPNAVKCYGHKTKNRAPRGSRFILPFTQHTPSRNKNQLSLHSILNLIIASKSARDLISKKTRRVDVL